MKTTGHAAKVRIAAVMGVALAGVGLAAVTQVAGAAEQPAEQSAAAQPAAPRAARITLPPHIQKVLDELRPLSPGAGFVPTAAHLVTSGTQTYTCDAAGAWPAGSTPEAQLAKLIGTGPSRIHHFGGPRWAERLPNGADGSTVLAAVQNRVPREGQLPWLLLNVTAHEGPAGGLDTVTHITRILTSGGLPPAGSCTPGEKSAPRPYGAVYVFWAAA